MSESIFRGEFIVSNMLERDRAACMSSRILFFRRRTEVFLETVFFSTGSLDLLGSGSPVLSRKRVCVSGALRLRIQGPHAFKASSVIRWQRSA